MAPEKRPLREVVDLTQDENGPSPKSRFKGSSSTSDSRRLLSSTQPDSPLGTSQTPPSSSQWEPETLDLTQAAEGPARELYGKLDAKIVGVRYYDGVATPGEYALCFREPSNIYDTNAIRVDNVLSQQIGHIPRKVASKLAPFIDSEDITIEAQIAGEKAAFDCPVQISLYGLSAPAERLRIEALLKQEKLLKATELKQTRKAAEERRKLTQLKNGGTTVGLATDDPAWVENDPTSLEALMESSEAIDGRQGIDHIKDMGIGERELEAMQMAPQPMQLRTQLLPYQLQGLAWMTAKESPQTPAPGSGDMTQLWKQDHKGRFQNVLSDFVSKTAPQFMSGGILADDMGLGKTIQVISLCMTGGFGPTLIVAPLSVMSNWDQQARQHTKPEYAPKVIIYHGAAKATAGSLTKYDIVVTSYGTLQREMDLATDQQVLLATDWRRVVLDEGHTIRNSHTKIAVAACKLKAQSRWLLSGTPIINSIKDLHSAVKFLHMTGGIESLEVFNAKITRPLYDGMKSAEILLRALMTDICLRRNKQMKFVDLKLPEKVEYAHTIRFSEDEQRRYDALLQEARGALEEYQLRSKSGVGQKGRFSGVLERLLRLRQVCNHWTLCRERVEGLLKLLEEQEVVQFSPKNRSLLQDLLQLFIESQEDCPICLEPPAEPVITHCKHIFCRGCISRTIATQAKCPMCRNALTEENLLEAVPEGSSDGVRLDLETQSSKTHAMMRIVEATLVTHGSKIIIFSQWTSFLNIVQAQLDATGHVYTRIDGTMNAPARNKAIEALDNDPNTRILLASLTVCGVGLNLVSANTVILSDSWWAPAIEDQAIDRVHRLGQTRKTTVWRLVVEGTVEQRVLDIQAEKRKIVSQTFGEQDGKRKAAKKSRLQDIQRLLE